MSTLKGSCDLGITIKFNKSREFYEVTLLGITSAAPHLDDALRGLRSVIDLQISEATVEFIKSSQPHSHVAVGRPLSSGGSS